MEDEVHPGSHKRSVRRSVNKNDTVGIQSSGFYSRGTCITQNDQPASKQAEARAALGGWHYVYLLPAEDSHVHYAGV